MDTLLHDLKYGFRMLIRRPGFAAVAVLTLGLGIGITTAMYSIVERVLLSPLPYHDPERLVMVWSRWAGWDKTWISELELRDYREQARTLTGLEAWTTTGANLTGVEGEPERISLGVVTAGLFDTLGVAPLHGRTFRRDEDVPGGPSLVILSHGLWQRRFGGDPGAVGRTLLFDGVSHQIVGVMPADFRLPLDYRGSDPAQAWVPAGLAFEADARGGHYLMSVARLGAGATVAEASEELRAITRRFTEAGLYPPQMRFDAFAISVADEILGQARPAVWLLFGAVGILLLIACANVANLLLARTEERGRELALRMAIGAGRGRVLRQLLAEGLVLSIVGGAVGLWIAATMASAIAAAELTSVPRLGEVRVDWSVALFAAALSIASTLLFSTLPALHATHADPHRSLKEGSANTTAGVERQRFRDALVGVEMALAVLLVIGAGLLLRSLWSLQQIPLGFDPSQVTTLRLSLPPADYAEDEDVARFFETALPRVRSLPGVRAAGGIRTLPLASEIGDWSLDIEGYEEPPGENANGYWQAATPGYFEAMGISRVRGRLFDERDRLDAPLVAIVDETLARQYWNGRDPIGTRLKMGSDASHPWAEVVGVVRDVRHLGFGEIIRGTFYLPHAQFSRAAGFPMRAMTLTVRADVPPASVVGGIRREIAALDPRLPIASIRTMDDVVASSLATPRYTAWLLTGFATTSLVLAAIGIYGLLSYVVARRTREIGIRLALGATGSHVRRLVLGRALLLASAGAAGGLALALVFGRTASSLLVGVRPADPLTLTIVPLVLLLVAFAAGLLPARRATRVDPIVALKAE